MSGSELLAWELVLAAFAGGAFGASIGALQSFTLAGLVVVIGEAYAVLARTLGVEVPVDLTGSVAFGVVLGPHVAFGGGAAAVAYAASQGYLDTDFEYHDAKNVTVGLGSRPDVLAVGGVFGAFGYVVASLSAGFGVPTDPVALGVVVSALAHRAAFGYSVVGDAAGQLFDMTPFERGQRRPAVDVAGDRGSDAGLRADGGTVDGSHTDDGSVDAGRADGGTVDGATVEGGHERGRLVVEPWLPYQYRWSHVAVLGVTVGALGGYLAHLTGSAFLAFGISVVGLAFLCADVADVPVTHHITLPASTAVVTSAGLSAPTPGAIQAAVPLGEALALGAAFGLLGALVGEMAQRALYAHAETHLDPPAASIVVTTAVIALLALGGVLPDAAWIPLP